MKLFQQLPKYIKLTFYFNTLSQKIFDESFFLFISPVQRKYNSALNILIKMRNDNFYIIVESKFKNDIQYNFPISLEMYVLTAIGTKHHNYLQITNAVPTITFANIFPKATPNHSCLQSFGFFSG